MSAPLHSRLPPSKAAIWSRCTASVGFIEANEHLLPPDKSSEFADEGTRAHLAASNVLGGKPAVFDNAEMEGHVNAFVTFVRDKIGSGDAVMIERRLPLFYFPEQRGTLDVGIRKPKSVYIIDLKYGVGVSVAAKDNEQLASYAESYIMQLEFIEEVPDDTLVTLVIFQPRDRNDPNPVRLWALSRAELRVFCNGISAAAGMILGKSKGVEFKAGEHCDSHFCRARGICKAYGSRRLEVIPDESIGAPPDPGSLTREQRIKIIKARPILEKWLEAVEDQEVAELMNGTERMGLKLVEGKANRQWADEDAAEKLLRNELKAEEVRPPASIISPAGAEKLLKGRDLSTKFQNKLNGLIVKPQGKPSLVPEEDKRPALSFHKDQLLEDIDVIG